MLVPAPFHQIDQFPHRDDLLMESQQVIENGRTAAGVSHDIQNA